VRTIALALSVSLALIGCAQTVPTPPTSLVFARATLISVRSGLDACEPQPPPQADEKGQETITLIEGNCYRLTVHIDRVLAGQTNQRMVDVPMIAQKCNGCTQGRQYLIVAKRRPERLEVEYFEPLATGLCPKDFASEELALIHDWQTRFPCSQPSLP
jgi:hypothetical protein